MSKNPPLQLPGSRLPSFSPPPPPPPLPIDASLLHRDLESSYDLQGFLLPPERDTTTVYADDAGRERKRKRNKPTLSCGECVERKTKCDRGRPHCLACIRRGTECRYRRRAEVIEDAASQPQIRRISGPPKPKRSQTTLPHGMPKPDPEGALSESSTGAASSPASPGLRRHSATSVEPLLSSIPHSVPSACNIYGIGSEHPFNNYWTLAGGLGEVVSVLPHREQADILIAKFFDSVDPIYPLLQQARFYAQYQAFWRLPPGERAQVEGSFLALLFVMLAMGTQFLRLPGDPVTAQQNQVSGAEFYASACHQVLRLGAYLNRTSVPTLQAMVLMTYFLMNANHASDGWSFAGIIIRQAYATGLNRDPSLLFDPGLNQFEKQERRRLWQGIVCQDAFMSVILRLPPGATHADIDRAAPLTDGGPSGESPPSTASSPPNPAMMSPGTMENSFDSINDVGYVTSMYTLALLVQETISSPRSLSLPMASTTRHRSQLLSRFRACYRSFPDMFRAWDENSIYELRRRDSSGQRLVRQILFLTSNYWHCVMLIQAEGCENVADNHHANDQAGPLASVKGTLEAGHEAIKAFFVLHAMLKGEAGTWWVMAHRAFTEALMMADLLRKYPQPGDPSFTVDPINSHWRQSSSSSRAGPDDPTTPLFAKARFDVLQMIEILKSVSAQDEISRTRVEVLEDIFARMHAAGNITKDHSISGMDTSSRSSSMATDRKVL